MLMNGFINCKVYLKPRVRNLFAQAQAKERPFATPATKAVPLMNERERESVCVCLENFR